MANLSGTQRKRLVQYLKQNPEQVFEHKELAASLGLSHQAVNGFLNGALHTLVGWKSSLGKEWCDQLGGLQWRGKGKFGWFPGQPSKASPVIMRKLEERKRTGRRAQTQSKLKPVEPAPELDGETAPVVLGEPRAGQLFRCVMSEFGELFMRREEDGALFDTVMQRLR